METPMCGHEGSWLMPNALTDNGTRTTWPKRRQHEHLAVFRPSERERIVDTSRPNCADPEKHAKTAE